MLESRSLWFIAASWFAMLALSATAVGFLFGWTRLARRLTAGLPALPHEPRRAVPWGLTHLAFAVLAFALIALACVAVARKTGEIAAPPAIESVDIDNANAPPKPAPSMALLWIDSTAKALTVAAVIVVLTLHIGATRGDLGLSSRPFFGDVALGIVAFCALAPAIFLLQALLVQIWPSKHPIVESLRENLTPELWTTAVVAAVVIAPIVEEFVFRVLLQGWLEAVCDRAFEPSWDPAAAILGLGADASRSRSIKPAAEPAAAVLEVVASDANPYRSSHLVLVPTQPPDAGETNDDVPRTQLGDVLPNVVTSALFAALHFSHGPDWVTLFLYSLTLGYLYRRTHRLWPSLFAHLSLNAFSMTMVTYALLAPAPK